MRRLTLIVPLLLAGCTPPPASDEGQAAVVAAVTAFEKALERYDLAYARAHRVEGATGIQELGGVASLDSGFELFEAANRLGVTIQYTIRNPVAQLSDDVAWVTLDLDATFEATSDSGVAMLRQFGLAQLPARRTYVETYILRRVGTDWHVAHIHSSPAVVAAGEPAARD